jgi:hypothetical protein
MTWGIFNKEMAWSTILVTHTILPLDKGKYSDVYICTYVDKVYAKI